MMIYEASKVETLILTFLVSNLLPSNFDIATFMCSIFENETKAIMLNESLLMAPPLLLLKRMPEFWLSYISTSSVSVIMPTVLT